MKWLLLAAGILGAVASLAALLSLPIGKQGPVRMIEYGLLVAPASAEFGGDQRAVIKKAIDAAMELEGQISQKEGDIIVANFVIGCLLSFVCLGCGLRLHLRPRS